MSSHFQAQSLAAQNVEMQMADGLTGIGTAVGNNTVTAIQAFCLGDLGNDFENVGYNSTVFSGDVIYGGDMGLGDYQNVGGRLGSNIPECEYGFILIDLGGRDGTCDDFTEQTVGHIHYLQIKFQ